MEHKSSTRKPSRNHWERIDLSRPLEQDRQILDDYTFAGLLLELYCNIPDEKLTPEGIREHFEQALLDKMQDAREVFAANLSEIYAAALADRADVQEPEDDMGEHYLPSHPDALRVIVGDAGQRTTVGAAGYLKMRREALDRGEDLAPWTELERYRAE